MKKLISVMLAVIMAVSVISVGVLAEESLPLRGFNISDINLRDQEIYNYYYDYTDKIVINNVIYGRKIIKENNKKSLANYYTVVNLFETKKSINTVKEINIESEINGVPVLTIENRKDYYDEYEGSFNPIVEKITLPNTLKCIGYWTFANFTKVKELILPENLEGIGAYAFCRMTSLEKITIPKKVKVIENSMLSYCTNLKKVKFEGKIKEIGEYAFNNCTNLNSITTPKSLEKVWEGAFCGSGIKRANINFKNIKKGDKHSRYFSEVAFCNNKRLKRLTVTANKVAIHEEVVYGAKNLKTVKIDSKYVSLGAKLFKKCKNLKSIKLTAKYAKVSKDAFKKIPKSCKIYVKSARVKKAITESGFKGKVIVKKNMK